MGLCSRPRKIRSCIPGLVVVISFATLMAPPVAQVAVAAGPPPTSPLAPGQARRLAANPTDRVIVLFRNQHPEIPGVPALRAHRAAVLAHDEAPVLHELASLGAPALRTYSFVNAVAATVSTGEAARLSANPSVLAVVPDGVVRGPTPTAIEAATGVSVPQPATVASLQGACPPDPSHPVLEPQALQLMHAEGGPGPAAHDLATGKNVKVAVFADGLDPDIADFRRADGRSAVFDYRDFTGEGLAAPTGGLEAFGDTRALVAQANQTYDLAGEVNPAAGLPAGCTIRIKGVAPDASVAVMKVFGRTNVAFDSEILQGIDWALTVDKVDVISESFTANPVPDPGQDPIAVLDADAVAAGVTVVVGTGDAGPANTIGSPALTGGVIRVGASTAYRLYAQTGAYGSPLAANGWLDNMVSAASSGGTTEFGPRTVDVVAPGEAGWADCSADTAVYLECADPFHGPRPQPIAAFAGTSQAAPMTAGVAALVIQAYRDSHGGTTPSPSLVRQIIMSSADDLHAPADAQGAGLVDALRAVQTARSVHDSHGSPPPAAFHLLYSPSTIDVTAPAGQVVTVPVTVTNTGPLPQRVSEALRVLGPETTLADTELTLSPDSDGTFVLQSGTTAHDVHTVSITVPSGTDRLLARVGWVGLASSLFSGGPTLEATLLDPSGRLASTSRPQGSGTGFAEEEVHDPQAGQWTLIVFDPTAMPYVGPVHVTVTGARWTPAPATTANVAEVAGGAAVTFSIPVAVPGDAGDGTEALAFEATGDAGPLAIVPVVLRALVPVDPATGGTFNGIVTGTNGRPRFTGQELTYQFDVPPGAPAIVVDVAVGAGQEILGFLVSPQQVPVDIQSSFWPDGSDNDARALHLAWAAPSPGRWTLVLGQTSGSRSLRTTTPVSGVIHFAAPTVTAIGLPVTPADVLPRGEPRHILVHVVNDGTAPAAYMVDPRLARDTAVAVPSAFATSGTLPITSSAPSVPQFVVPPFTSRLLMVANSTVPISFDTSPAFGSPDLLSIPHGTAAIVTYQADPVPASVWSCTPTEVANGTVVPARYDCAAIALTKPFDPAVSSSTGDAWQSVTDAGHPATPLLLLPGQSGDISVTITPRGHPGDVVDGFLAVEAHSIVTLSSDELATIPYHYTVG